MRLLKIELIVTLSYLSSVRLEAPSLYGIGCNIVDGVLYTVGGKTFGKTRNATDDTPSKTVYSLDLKSGFELDSGLYAPWKPLAEDESPGAHIPGVVVHKPSKSIFMFGGEKVPFSSSFQVFNTVTKKWSLDTTAIQNLPDLTLSTGEKAKYSVYVGSFVADDLNDNVFYQYGGMTQTNNLDAEEAFSDVFVYDASTKSWSTPKSNKARVTGHTAQYYKGKMYIVGGMGFFDLKLMPMDKVMVFDMSSNKWSNITVKGEIPEARFGLSSAMVGSWMVILGGTETTKFNAFPSSDVFYLDLSEPDNLTWNKIRMDGFNPAGYGCLAYYNDHLIYSFGARNDIMSTTQLINMNTKELVKSLPAKIDSDSSNAPTIDFPLNLPAILSGGVSAFLFLILIWIALWHFLKHLKRKEKETIGTKSKFVSTLSDSNSYRNSVDSYQPPNLLYHNIWSDKPIEIPEPFFTLNTFTYVPDFDDDLVVSYTNYSSQFSKFSNSLK